MNTTQGWFAARLKMGYAHTQNNGGPLYWVSWADDGNNYIYGAWTNDGVGEGWAFGRKAASAGSQGIWLPDTFAANDHRTIIMRYDATTWAGSLQGAAFASLSNTNIPTLVDPYFSIGYSNGITGASQINSTYYWFAWGAGTLSDADAVTINGWGDADPALVSFPSAALVQGVWPCDSFAYSATWALPPQVMLTMGMLGTGRY